MLELPNYTAVSSRAVIFVSDIIHSINNRWFWNWERYKSNLEKVTMSLTLHTDYWFDFQHF